VRAKQSPSLVFSLLCGASSNGAVGCGFQAGYTVFSWMLAQCRPSSLYQVLPRRLSDVVVRRLGAWIFFLVVGCELLVIG
jgi:hypothetical protein